MNPSAAIDTRHALRAGTRAAHDRVDAQFAGGIGSDAAYAVYLRGMHAFAGGIDAALGQARLSPTWRAWSETPRAAWLQADLDALSLSPIDAPRLDTPAPQRDGDDDAFAAGTLYVLEGSALGARTLLGGARRLGHDARRGAVFLEGHADGDHGRRWPRFAAALGSAAFDDAASQARLLQAANAAFGHVERCVSLAAADAACSQTPAMRVTAVSTPAGTAPAHHARSPR